MKEITFDQLHRIAGYVEAGEGESVTYFQDDATKTWHVRVGKKTFHGESMQEAFEKALDDSNAYYVKTYRLSSL